MCENLIICNVLETADFKYLVLTSQNKMLSYRRETALQGAL